MLVLLGGISALTGPAHAAAGPHSLLPQPEAQELSLSASLVRGWIAPFEISPRDEFQLRAVGRWSPAPRATFAAEYPWLWGSWPDGHREQGSGDLVLTGAGAALQGDRRRPALWLYWSGKLPNAPDSTGLGTDETDIRVGGMLAWTGAESALRLGGALLIMGNPIQFANQDDAAELSVEWEGPLGPLQAGLETRARLASPRNPLDARAGLRLGYPWERWQAGLVTQAGLSPAAPDWLLSLWWGFHPQPRD